MRLFIFIFFTISWLFGLEIYFEKEFSKRIEPKKMTTNILFGMDAKTYSEIRSGFDKFISELRESQNACKGGEYFIVPNYDYKLLPPKFLNYSGKMQLECEFEDINELEKAVIIIEKNLTPNHKIAYLPIIWQLDQKEIESTKDMLRLDSILYGEYHKTELEAKLQKKCTIKEIKVSQIKTPQIEQSTKLRAITIEEPIKSEKSLSIIANYIISCHDNNGSL